MKAAYDFAKVGVPGLTAGVVYLHGDDIDTRSPASTDSSEWERDLTVGYVVPEGPLKNVGLMWKNATWRTNIPGQRDQDENRRRAFGGLSAQPVRICAP